jgi:hypothetical protein
VAVGERVRRQRGGAQRQRQPARAARAPAHLKCLLSSAMRALTCSFWRMSFPNSTLKFVEMMDTGMASTRMPDMEASAAMKRPVEVTGVMSP